jgi:uncharacterized protein YkwD
MWIALAALAALLQGCPAGSGMAARAPADPQGYERRVFDAVNRERAARRMPALAWDGAVARQARAHSARMRDLGFFSHDDPELGGVSARLSGAGILWTATAENIYTARGFQRPDLEALKSWMGSPPHRRNLLDPRYTRSAVGVVTGPDGTYWFTQIFLRP